MTAGPGVRRLGRVALLVWAGLGLAWLFVPIVVIVAYSFNDPAGQRNLAWNRFSLDAWANPFDPAVEGDALRDALLLSLSVAAVATAVALVLGTLVAAGKGKLETDDIKRMLETRRREQQAVTVKPNGLFLYRVFYDGEVPDAWQAAAKDAPRNEPAP